MASSSRRFPGVFAACAVLVGSLFTYAPVASATVLPPIRHVFVIVEENESEATTFGVGSPAPYLSQTLTADGAYLSGYYGIGHASLDNYIAMVSGQAPNALTSGDCQDYVNFNSLDLLAANGQMSGQGCIYPSSVPSLMSQLDGAGYTWKAYEDSMGSDPARESATCGHPTVGGADGTEAESASPFDAYATRHDPFMYFHYVIDNPAECNADVVSLDSSLDQLKTDLTSVSTTPNYVFITPDLCDDGHDATCANGGAGGLVQADKYLQQVVPVILNSPAYQENGLLIITFDESEGDDSSCCGEFPGPDDLTNNILPGGGGPGGGLIGAVLLSPYISPGTVTGTTYDHYSMLATVEDIFGLSRLGEANCVATFGPDVFTGYPGVTAGAGDPSSPDCTADPDNISQATTTSTTTTTTPTTSPKPPVLTRLKLSSKVLGPSARKLTTTVSYVDSQAALTSFVIDRLLPGYRHNGHACTALPSGHHRPAHTKACTATQKKASFTHRDVIGTNKVTLNARAGGRPLPAGSYELVATPFASGLHGVPITVRFTIK